MPTYTLADYITLQDTSNHLTDSSATWLFFQFSLPDTFVQGINRARPIIQFKFRANRSTTLQIRHFPNSNSATDSTQVVSANFEETSFFRTYFELINGNIFVPNSQQRLRFSVHGDGEMDIADVILVFQRRVTI